MSERRSAADLGSHVEEALHAFPFADRDWESDARAVEVKLTASVPRSTSAQLLAPPFPSEPGEPTALSATTTPLAHSGVRTQSLAEMARRSVEQKQSAERAIARESLALAALSRPSGEEATVLRETVSAVRAVPSPAVAASVTAAPAPRAAGALAPAQNAQSPWSKVGLAVGGLALAAAVLVWLRQAAPAPLESRAVLPAAAQAVPQSAAVQAPAPQGVVGRAAAPSAQAAIDPSTLSQEASAQTADLKRAKPVSAGAAAAAPALSASAPGASPEKVVLEDEQPKGALAQVPAEKTEQALPPDPALRPADSTGGAMPVKPSTGAVQAALGAVMSGARHCVAGDEAASSAVVVFGSDGHVQRVAVSGPATGKPSGACIEAQLSRARVQPFAATSFSVNATVRPD